jgi:multimeric flavodoxin WrbA
MRTLIINGSPRPNGDITSLLGVAKQELTGEIVEISAYRNKISPCVDCRACHKKIGCQIIDDMQIILDNNFDNVIIASPVHMGTLTPPMLSILSRFQANYVAKRFLNSPIEPHPKKAVIILVGGGDGEPHEALRQSKFLARSLGGTFTDKTIITSLKTDFTAAIEDAVAVHNLKEAIRKLNADS